MNFLLEWILTSNWKAWLLILILIFFIIWLFLYRQSPSPTILADNSDICKNLPERPTEENNNDLLSLLTKNKEDPYIPNQMMKSEEIVPKDICPIPPFLPDGTSYIINQNIREMTKEATQEREATKERITKELTMEATREKGGTIIGEEAKRETNICKLEEEKKPKAVFNRYKRRMFEPAPYSKRTDFGSKREAICCKIIEEIYQKPFHKIRPNFLKNPLTGYNLELDCYNDELKIAIEYQGEQHYKHPNYTGQTFQQFIYQVQKDKYKVDACDRNGVYLITVPYNVPDCMLRKYIEYYLPENVQARLAGNPSPVMPEFN